MPVDAQRRRAQGLPERDNLPRNLILPHRSGRPGTLPHWLGPQWAATVTSWRGKSTGEDPYGQGRENPYGGISPDTRFFFDDRQPGPEITLDRLHRRRSLLDQLHGQASSLL